MTRDLCSFYSFFALHCLVCTWRCGRTGRRGCGGLGTGRLRRLWGQGWAFVVHVLVAVAPAGGEAPRHGPHWVKLEESHIETRRESLPVASAMSLPRMPNEENWRPLWRRALAKARHVGSCRYGLPVNQPFGQPSERTDLEDEDEDGEEPDEAVLLVRSHPDDVEHEGCPQEHGELGEQRVNGARGGMSGRGTLPSAETAARRGLPGRRSRRGRGVGCTAVQRRARLRTRGPGCGKLSRGSFGEGY
jgi:hypothetical protein